MCKRERERERDYGCCGLNISDCSPEFPNVGTCTELCGDVASRCSAQDLYKCPPGTAHWSPLYVKSAFLLLGTPRMHELTDFCVFLSAEDFKDAAAKKSSFSTAAAICSWRLSSSTLIRFTGACASAFAPPAGDCPSCFALAWSSAIIASSLSCGYGNQ